MGLNYLRDERFGYMPWLQADLHSLCVENLSSSGAISAANEPYFQNKPSHPTIARARSSSGS